MYDIIAYKNNLKNIRLCVYDNNILYEMQICVRA